MSFKATAVVKKETKVDFKKPTKRFITRLCLCSTKTAKDTVFHVIWVSFVTLQLVKREAGVNARTIT